MRWTVEEERKHLPVVKANFALQLPDDSSNITTPSITNEMNRSIASTMNANPLRNPVQLGAHGSACVRASSLLMRHCFCVSYRPSRSVWSGAIASVMTRLCASVQALHWRVVVPVGDGDGAVV